MLKFQHVLECKHCYQINEVHEWCEGVCPICGKHKDAAPSEPMIDQETFRLFQALRREQERQELLDQLSRFDSAIW